MPWGEDQGDFVLINEEDFDPNVHKRYDEGAKKAATQPKASVDELRAALTAKGIEIPEGAKKADLQALLDKADAEGASDGDNQG
ncbi:hypothetical protein EHF44_16770 [Cupriavidus pauculus]|uniref:HeH/LEM domain-containing protein n=3 Tax=Pseudomonadota TaxID=1224 RepID=A0A3G8H785_9BURK|nr:hypothetical protein EHF44_16770 [Cupriavidus pauculus]